METQSPLPTDSHLIQGFLQAATWAPVPASHLDQRFASFLRRGIEHRLRIGVDRTYKLRASSSHLPSAEAHAYLISRRIAEEIAAGTLTAAPSLPIQDVHTSLIGIIPKPHQPGKFRLVIDLSTPHGASINDAISPELSSLTYPRVDQAVALISEHGRGTHIAKLDLHSAYNKVPVHPDDSYLLGIHWEGTTYIDCAFPFGLCSTPNSLQQWRTDMAGL